MTGPVDDELGTNAENGVGCRSGILAGLALLGFALVAAGTGLTLILSDTCTGWCERAGLALFYAGAPASALFGVVGGGIPIAWPLDLGMWVVLGLAAANWAARRSRPTWHGVVALMGLALVFGAALSGLVEVDRA